MNSRHFLDLHRFLNCLVSTKEDIYIFFHLNSAELFVFSLWLSAFCRCKEPFALSLKRQTPVPAAGRSPCSEGRAQHLLKIGIFAGKKKIKRKEKALQSDTVKYFQSLPFSRLYFLLICFLREALANWENVVSLCNTDTSRWEQPLDKRGHCWLEWCRVHPWKRDRHWSVEDGVEWNEHQKHIFWMASAAISSLLRPHPLGRMQQVGELSGFIHISVREQNFSQRNGESNQSNCCWFLFSTNITSVFFIIINASKTSRKKQQQQICIPAKN